MKKYKFNVTNGTKYLQIWDENGFVMSCGTADKLYNKLVEHEKLLEQTKKKWEVLTKKAEEFLS